VGSRRRFFGYRNVWTSVSGAGNLLVIQVRGLDRGGMLALNLRVHGVLCVVRAGADAFE